MNLRLLLIYIILLKLPLAGLGQIETNDVDFELDKTEGCTPLHVSFKDKSPNANRWFWNFGNGNISEEQNPSSIFTEGKYTVTLMAWDIWGALLGTSKKEVEVFALPDMQIVTKETKGCKETTLEVGHINRNGYDIISTRWNLGEGEYSKNKKYSLSTAESKRVVIKLKVIDEKGCISFVEKTYPIDIHKFQEPIIIPSREVVYTCDLPVEIEFKEGSRVLENGLVWNFGNGKTSENINPTHQFDSYGMYNITLEAVDHLGCKTKGSKEIKIIDSDKIAPKLDRQLLCSPGSVNGEFGESLPGWVKTSVLWSFGEGKIQTPGTKVNYYYADTGVFDVTVYSWVGKCYNVHELKVDVLDIKPPAIEAEVIQDRDCDNIYLQLIDNSKHERNFWKVDGRKIEHKDTVSLALKTTPKKLELNYFYGNKNECYSTKSFSIIDSRPSFNVYSSCIGEVCKSTSYRLSSQQMSGSACKVKWFLGDSLLSKKHGFSIDFKERKKYVLRFEAIDSLGCSFIKTISINVPVIPKMFSVTSDVYYEECPPAICNFNIKEEDENKIQNVSWKFGDGNESYRRAPQNFYTKPGKYDMSITASYKNGCKLTLNKKGIIEVGGPKAKLTQSGETGCAPLDVDYKLSDFESVSTFIFDFGDGITKNYTRPSSISHTYTRPNSSNEPSVILIDEKGCSVPIKGKRVTVYRPVKINDVLVKGKCSNEPIEIAADLVSATENKKFKWMLDGRFVGDKHRINLLGTEPGTHRVSVLAESNRQCKDTLSKEFEVYLVKARLDKLADTLCMTNSLRLEEDSQADNPIKRHWWYEEDSIIGEGYVLNHTFGSSGKKTIKYLMIDQIGCKDSIVLDKTILVGDTISNTTGVDYVSCLSNNAAEVVFEKHNSFDFKAYKVWSMDSDPFLLDTVLDPNVNHYIDETNTGKKSRCYAVSTRNICNTKVDPLTLRKHCTVELKTEPDTNRVDLKWSRYIGKDNVGGYRVVKSVNGGPYQHLFQTKSDITHFVDTNTTCHMNYSYKIITEFIGESFSSVSDTSNETPPFKNFIPEFYPFLVGLDKNEKDLNIEFSGHFPNLKSKLDSVFVTISSEKGVSFIDKLKIRNDSSKAYSLYKNGGPFFITTSVKNRCGETSHRTKICNTVYLEVVLNKDNYPELSWTEYNYWPSGASRYIVQRRVQGIGFVEIDNVYGETSYVDKSILQTCLDKVEYRVVAVPFVENVGFYSLKATDKSYSNTSTLRSAPVVFIPNAFTPNGNGLNDSFRPSISYSKHTELDVFNKYGEKLTSKRGCHLGWNGEHNGSLCPNGTYTYILRATGTDDRTYTYSGTVTLIR